MMQRTAGRLSGTWAALWLSWMLVLLVGLAIAWSTGQLDPGLWSIPAALTLAVVGLWRGRLSALSAAAGMALTVLIFCWVGAARAPAPGAAFLFCCTLLAAALAGAWLGRDARRGPRHRMAGAIALVLTLILVRLGEPAQVEPARQRPDLAVVTALPLFWDKQRRRDAPIIQLLQTRFTVRAMDDPLALARSSARHLLLAQPHAMPPDRLVAIDAWVRNGGTALILADPLLRWPSDMPIGDRRAAPAVSLLDPLLGHWGIQVGAIQEGEARQFFRDGQLLTLSDFANTTSSCGDDQSGVTQCSIGKGRVVLIADADLLDDRLWLRDPARPLDPRVWTADTPALVAQWLDASLPGNRHWMKTPDTVTRGLRWAFIAGTLWAILGAAFGMRRNRRASSTMPEAMERRTTGT